MYVHTVLTRWPPALDSHRECIILMSFGAGVCRVMRVCTTESMLAMGSSGDLDGMAR